MFDKDFNFLRDEKSELELSDAQKKYAWWDFKGEEFQSEIISVSEKDELILKKRVFDFTYNWKKMVYNSKSKTKESQKLRNEDGGKYFHYRNWWSFEDIDNVYILCGMTSKQDEQSYCKNFHLLKINKSLDVVKNVEIKFDYPQEVVYPRFVDDKADAREVNIENDMFCIFAPKNVGKKVSDPSIANYTYIRISKNLDLLDRISFNSPTCFWSIEGNVFDKRTDACYLFGASLNGKGQYFSDLKSTSKFDGFQIIKVADHKVEYITNTRIDEFLTKQVMPPSAKNLDSYDGKRFTIADYGATPDGNLFIAGQNYSTRRNIQTLQKITTYADCFAFGFDKTGNLIGQYTYNVKGFMGGQEMPIIQKCFVGKNPQNIYWLTMQPEYTSIDIFAGFGPSWFDIISSDICKVDLSANKMTDFYNYQRNREKKKFYYLNLKMPYLETVDNKLILFGSQGFLGNKRLWFARIRLD
ncbi:MAG: hypothetical protein NTV01_20390 [Bacteroidia bacterium]|nr:hypothetical protein [Bacteroidia bacterium]